MSDGGAPLIGYVVELRVPASVKKGEDGWKRCNVAAQLVVCEFTVTSLDEKLVYEFRVSAQNQVGMSLPCDLEGAVIPKDILGEDLNIKPPFCREKGFLNSYWPLFLKQQRSSLK